MSGTQKLSENPFTWGRGEWRGQRRKIELLDIREGVGVISYEMIYCRKYQ